MNKFISSILIANVATIMISSIAFAGKWNQDQRGWYWEDKDGGQQVSTWAWLDGNQDGISECYYFDEQGYLITDAEIAGGYLVDDEGRWIEDNVIQTRMKGSEFREPGCFYKDAVARLNALDSYEAFVDIESGSVNIYFNIKYNNSYGPVGYMQDSSIFFNDKFEGRDISFYNNGYYHTTRFELGPEFNSINKYKISMEQDMALWQLASPMSTVVLAPEDLTDFQFINVTREKQQVSFKARPEAFEAIAGNFTDSAIPNYTSLSRGDIRDIHGGAEIDSGGNLIRSEIQINYMVNETSYNLIIQVDYVDPGRPSTFSIQSSPEYIEVFKLDRTPGGNIDRPVQQAMEEIVEPDDIRQIYADSVRKTSVLDDYAVGIRFTHDVRNGNSLKRIKTADLNIKMKNKNSSESKYVMDLRYENCIYQDHYQYIHETVSYAGGYAFHEFADGYQYGETEVKSLEELMDYYGNPLAGVVWNPNYLTEMSIADVADGARKITFTLSDEGAEWMVQQVPRLPIRDGRYYVTEGKVSGGVTIDSEGYLTESEIFIQDRKNGTWYIGVSFTNPGEAVEITLPEFVEYDSRQ